MKLLLATILLFLCQFAQSMNFVVTIDDSPGALTSSFSQLDRTIKLSAVLPPGSVFFFWGRNLSSQSFLDHQQVLFKAKHYIGNHTRDHSNIDEVSSASFIASALDHHHFLNRSPAYRPWFRYPFLNESTDAQRSFDIKSKLKSSGLSFFPITVEVWDWHLNDLVQQRGAKCLDFNKLKQLYISMVVDSAEFYEAERAKHKLPAIPHTILLHHNDLSANYVGDVIKEMQRRGHNPLDAEKVKALYSAIYDESRLYSMNLLSQMIFYQSRQSLANSQWLDKIKIADAFGRTFCR